MEEKPSLHIEDLTEDTRSKRKRLGGTYCVAKGCHHNQQRDKHVKFFKFPKKNKIQRDLWTEALDRQKPDGSSWCPTPSSLLCSAHFISGQWSRDKADIDYIPSVFSQERKAQKRPRCKKGFLNGRRSVPSQTDIALVQPLHFIFTCSLDPRSRCANTQISSKIIPCISVKTETHHNPLSNASTNTEEFIGLSVDTFGDVKFKAFTGIDGDFFNTLVYSLKEDLKPSPRLTKKNKILIFLIKIRLGLTFTVLSGFFGVTQKTIKFCFLEVLEAFYSFAKAALTWCSREEITYRMPGDFRALFPECRVLLHCCEVETERPKEPKQQSLMYSEKRQKFTLRFILGIAPHGDITFVSKCSGGCTPEAEVGEKSGILDILEPGDLVLSEKELMSLKKAFQARNAELVVPARKHLKFRSPSSSNVSDGCLPTAVHVHVERAVRKMKAYKLLHFVPHHMVSYMDKILVITAFLCNGTPSIIINDVE